jgi:hypothetical protein
MKKVCFLLVVLPLMMTMSVIGQAFIEPIINLYYLKGNACTVTLESGEEIQGNFISGSFLTNGLSQIIIERENGEETKFMAKEIISVFIKNSEDAKMEMIMESTWSVQKMVNTDYHDILNREYIIFETTHDFRKKDKQRLMQLVNPGFDTKIKVYAEPLKQTAGIGVGPVMFTGGEERAYLLVKANAYQLEVKKGNYDRYFKYLYSDCPEMISTFAGDKITWNDIALHVFVYDQACK